MSKVKRQTIQKTYLHYLSLSPFACHYYYQPADGFNRTDKHRANQFNLENNKHSGVISDKGRKRLELAVSWLLYGAKPKLTYCSENKKQFKFKINFITLTLPAAQIHSDKEITSVCLGNFLDVCRKYVGLENYVWRAEAQCNGNIHFHLVTDKFIHYTKIRKWWNQSTELLGYVSRFEKKWHHREPNSEDVHSVKHVNRISSYLSKYMAKERAFGCIGELRMYKGKKFEILYGSREYRAEQSGKKKGRVVGHVLGGLLRKIESRLWFCSRSLSGQKSINVGQDEYVWKGLTELIQATEHKAYQGEFVRSLYGDFSNVVTKLRKYKQVET